MLRRMGMLVPRRYQKKDGSLMLASKMIALLQDLIDQDGDRQVRYAGNSVTGIWIMPPNPTTQERHIALSTGTTTGRVSVK